VTDSWPQFSALDEDSAGTGNFKREQLQDSGEESLLPASKSVTIDNTGETAAKLVQGIEQVNRDVC
jgi:hypothetical protein